MTDFGEPFADVWNEHELKTSVCIATTNQGYLADNVVHRIGCVEKIRFRPDFLY